MGSSAGDPTETEIAAHLAGCAPCRDRLHALEAVRDAVRTPVPQVPPAVRAHAVSAVVARLQDDGDTGQTIESESSPERQRDVAGQPLKPIVLPRRWASRAGPAAAAAVVALLAAGVTVALVSQHGTTSNTSRAASGAVAASTTAPPGAQRHANGANAGSASAYSRANIGGSGAVLARLGTVSSVSALRSSVGRVLSGTASSKSTAGLGLNGAGKSPNQPSGVDVPATTAPSTNGLSATAPSTSPSFSTAAGGTQSESGLARALQGCVASARRSLAGGSHTVEVGASSTYRGTAALVYLFSTGSSKSSASSPSPPAGGSTAAAALVVVATHGCRVLVSTTL